MTQSRKPNFHSDEPTTAVRTGATTAMRVIVPLQGVVQGRGGLVLGSVIPCALFYFFQLYLKRKNRSPPAAPETPPVPEVLHGLQRVQSRSIMSPRGTSGSAHVSSRANSVVKHGDNPYYVGLKRVEEDPFDESSNPDGVIQLGLGRNMINMKGLDGIQGPIYVGTGSVFRRQALYGYDAPVKKKAPGKTCNCLPKWCCCCFGSRKNKKVKTSKDKKKKAKNRELSTQVHALENIEEGIEGIDSENSTMMAQIKFEKKFGQSPVFIASTLIEDGGVPPGATSASLLKEAIHVIS